jgi:hypothetical protein
VSETQEKYGQEKIASIEQKLGFFDFRLTKSEAILEKIEENLSKITILIEKHQVLREDLTILEKKVDTRTAKTDPIINMAERTVGKIQGAGLVITMFLGLLTWIGAGVVDRVVVLEKDHKDIELRVQKNEGELHAHMVQDQVQHEAEQAEE